MARWIWPIAAVLVGGFIFTRYMRNLRAAAQGAKEVELGQETAASKPAKKTPVAKKAVTKKTSVKKAVTKKTAAKKTGKKKTGPKKKR